MCFLVSLNLFRQRKFFKKFSGNIIDHIFRCCREMKRRTFETSFIFFYFLDVWKMLEDKKFDDVTKIIKQKPNLINSMRGVLGRTFLMNAARYKQKDIVEYLSSQQQDLSVADDRGLNVLHEIVAWNDDDVTFEMLDSLDISQLNDDVINKQNNNYKYTPLHYAAWMNKHKSIVWLMDQGADPSLKDDDDERPDESPRCSDETKNIIRNFKMVRKSFFFDFFFFFFLRILNTEALF